MVLVGKKGLIFGFIISLAGTAFLGIWGYSLISDASEEGLPEALFSAERFLYISILLFLVILFVALRLFIKSGKVLREMDKLIDYSRMGSFTPGIGLKKIGIIGEKIALLYSQLNLLNEKRALKISAMSELVEFLAANTDIPLAITDVAGKITEASKVFMDKTKTTRPELIGKPIEEIMPDLLVPEILLEIERRHTFVERSVSKDRLICYPVFDRNNNLSYLIFSLEKRQLFFSREARAKLEQAFDSPRLQKGFLNRLGFGRARNKE